MAQKVLVEMVDDLDGSAANQTVPFSLDGVHYEIDLSQENANELRDGIARFVSASRRVGGRKVRLAAGQSVSGSQPAAPADRERSRLIRAWAIDNGHTIAERGRIPSEIVEAYEQHELEPIVVEAPTKAARKRAPRKRG